MPYIEPDDRTDTDFPERAISREKLGEMVGDACRNGGDLQYILAVAIDTYIARHGLRYQQLQDIMGALAGGLHEFQRCVVDPYEKKKIEDNGRVYRDISEYPSSGY